MVITDNKSSHQSYKTTYFQKIVVNTHWQVHFTIIGESHSQVSGIISLNE